MANPINVSSLNVATTSQVSGNRGAGTDAPRQAVATGGNTAPAPARGASSGAASAQDVAQATRDISQYIQTVNRSLQISVDKALGSTIITVVDSETEEVVRQIPQEEIVAVARFIEQQLASDTGGSGNAVRGLLVDRES
jgi:flagellar protein FlaG